jgi:glutathione S-transferase
MDKLLAKQPYMMGDALTVLDVAWLIYAHRLSLAGYPFRRLHPHVFAWKEMLSSRPEFAKEIAPVRHRERPVSDPKPADIPPRDTLEAVAGL